MGKTCRLRSRPTSPSSPTLSAGLDRRSLWKRSDGSYLAALLVWAWACGLHTRPGCIRAHQHSATRWCLDVKRLCGGAEWLCFRLTRRGPLRRPPSDRKQNPACRRARASDDGREGALMDGPKPGRDPDPTQPGRVRYWPGSQWSTEVRPAQSNSPGRPSGRGLSAREKAVAVGLAVAFVLIMAVIAANAGGRKAVRTDNTSPAARVATTTVPPKRPTVAVRATTPVQRPRPTSPVRQPRRAAPPPTSRR
jgi:hypothetical protein